MPSTPVKILLVASFAAFLVAVAWLVNAMISGPEGSRIVRIGGPFALIDQNRQPRSDADFRGEYMLIYFGYTYCPDVCPTALSDMSLAMDALGEDAAKVRPILITVDPARDTPERLKAYVPNFHPRMVGLTGSDEAVTGAAKAYRVYFAKADTDAPPGEYLMDHTSIIYLMGPEGNYLTHFSHGTSADAMAKRIRENMS